MIYSQVNLSRLAEHVDAYGAESMAMLQQLAAGFVARGSDVITAREQALAALYGMTMREASMQSFLELFQLLGVVCLALLPLVLILRRPRPTGYAAAHAGAE
jgi:MFS transporter, DHA2 family, multidrug resistance protein